MKLNGIRIRSEQTSFACLPNGKKTVRWTVLRVRPPQGGNPVGVTTKNTHINRACFFRGVPYFDSNPFGSVAFDGQATIQDFKSLHQRSEKSYERAEKFSQPARFDCFGLYVNTLFHRFRHVLF